jgi:hypothetical protein
MTKRHTFDMNQCKPGDLLESTLGAKLKYIGKEGTEDFPHDVKYLWAPDEKFADNSMGTRTDEGWVYANKPLPTDHDIKGFWNFCKD